MDHRYSMGKLKYLLIFAAIFAMPGWESADAAQPNGLKNFFNKLDRRVCQKFNATCKSRSKQTAPKRKKQTKPHVPPEKIETSAATPITEPPMPVAKPKTAQNVAMAAPVPRPKPQDLQEQAVIEPTALPTVTKSVK